MKPRHLALAAFALSITTAFAAPDESNLVLLDTVNPAIRDLAEIAGDYDVDPDTQQPTAQLVYDRLNPRNKIGVFYSQGIRSNDGYSHGCHLLKPQDERSPNTWRVDDFSSADDSALFMMNHLPGDTRFLPLPLVDAAGAPWPWTIAFDRLSWTSIQAGRTYQDFQNYVDTSLGAGASAGKIQIYKRLEFPSELNYIPKGSGPFGGEKDYDTNRANFSDTAKKFVIVLHGWNTSPMRDPYADDDWKPFFNSLHTEMTNNSPFVDGWDLYAYRWGQDSYTGNLNGNGGVGSTLSLTNLGIDIDPQNTHGAGGVGVGVENGTQAAEIGYQHGLVLGKLIWEHCEKQKISPEKIHFVAHSAGTWVARSASLYLSKQYPLLDQQITLMDPYNPRAGHDEWDNLGDGFPKDVDDSELRTDTINAWVNAVNPLRAENIFSMDELVSGTNSYYGGGFVNQQVGSSSYGNKRW